MTEEEKQKLEAEKAAAIAEAEALKTSLAEKEAALKALQDKDLNFGKLREKTAEEIKKAEEAKLSKEQEVATLSQKVADMEANITKTAEERKGRLVTAYAGKDAELQKTILFHFERVKGTAKTDSEIEAAMKDAYVLATGGRADQDVIRSVQGVSSGGTRVNAKPTGGELTPEAKELADQFNKHGANIKPEDLANPKYAVKPSQSAESNYTL